MVQKVATKPQIEAGFRYARGGVVKLVRAAWLWCRKSPQSVSSRLGFAMQRLENSLCQPSSKWIPFLNKGRIRQRKERDGLHLSSAVPKIQWDSNPHCPYSYKAMGNLYLFLPLS